VTARPPSPTPEGEDAHSGAIVERQRREFGVRLLRLRHAAGLTQRQLAERLDVRQPTVSRFEAGRDMPTPEMLRRLADALGSPEETRRELEDRLAELRIEVRAARLLLRQGAGAVQFQIGQREAHATSVWSYHHALVPGLLQTADYTREMAAVLDPEIEVDVEEFVSARQDRQRLLLDPARSFRFLVTEAALRARVAPVPVLRAQVRRVLALVGGFNHLAVGVVPSTTPLTAWTLTGFDIIGDHVEVGYLTGSVIIRDPRDVDMYRRLFDLLDAQAVHGEALVTLLSDVDTWLASLPE
jgi:transcriptional regulator with XRE-family HTH domain